MTLEELESKLNDVENEFHNKYSMLEQNNPMLGEQMLAEEKGACILEFVNEMYDGVNYNPIKLDVAYSGFSDFEKSIISNIKRYQKDFNSTVHFAIEYELGCEWYMSKDLGMDWLCLIFIVSYYAYLKNCLYPDLAIETAKAIYDFKTGRYNKLFKRGDVATLELYCHCLQNEIGRMATEIVKCLKDYYDGVEVENEDFYD